MQSSRSCFARGDRGCGAAACRDDSLATRVRLRAFCYRTQGGPSTCPITGVAGCCRGAPFASSTCSPGLFKAKLSFKTCATGVVRCRGSRARPSTSGPWTLRYSSRHFLRLMLPAPFLRIRASTIVQTSGMCGKNARTSSIGAPIPLPQLPKGKAAGIQLGASVAINGTCLTGERAMHRHSVT